MSLPPILFIRHGETAWNRVFRLQGQQDIPLNALGRRQAARNGRAVAGLLRTAPTSWEIMVGRRINWDIVASPLERARETMEIALVAAGLAGTSYPTDPLLLEVSYGSWEGMTLTELAAHDPDGHGARERDKWGFVPPAGESYAMLLERVSLWLDTLTGPTFVAAHGGVLRVLLHRLAGIPHFDAPHIDAPQDRAFLFTRRTVAAI